MARGTERKSRGILLRKTLYKESSLVLDFLGEEGLLVVSSRLPRMGKGAGDALLYEEGQESALLLREGRAGGLRLLEGRSLDSPPRDFKGLSALSFMARASWLALPAIEGKRLYPVLSHLRKVLIEGGDPLTTVLLLLAFLLKEAGYGWMVDGCLRCGATSGIAALSPEEGGFLCEKEEIPGDALRGVPLLRLARTLFKGDPLRYEGDPIDPWDGRKLLLALEGHFERSFGKKIPGLKMFMSAIDG